MLADMPDVTIDDVRDAIDRRLPLSEQHTGIVLKVPHAIRVEQRSDTVWIAAGIYQGKLIEAPVAMRLLLPQ
jgi:hypothetical protein